MWNEWTLFKNICFQIVMKYCQFVKRILTMCYRIVYARTLCGSVGMYNRVMPNMLGMANIACIEYFLKFHRTAGPPTNPQLYCIVRANVNRTLPQFSLIVLPLPKIKLSNHWWSVCYVLDRENQSILITWVSFSTNRRFHSILIVPNFFPAIKKLADSLELSILLINIY